jgi:hypothetical protein
MSESKQPSPAASFAVSRWRPDVWPGDQRKADRVVRQFRAELVAAGALVRVGRELIILEARYEAWLSRHDSEVENFDVAANRRRMVQP